MNSNNKILSTEQHGELINVLKARFEKNMGRHKSIEWAKVQAKLQADNGKLWSLNEMEISGGEPDVVGYDEETGEYLFYDCSAESPVGRRNLCYDREAFDARKQFKPENNAVDVAAAMGIALLSEEQYRGLQQLGKFDTKTSSWIQTPAHIRKLGGALFCDRRYDTVFVFHNGAECYYAGRGFRGWLAV
jgi:hypothetical protein